MSWPMLIEELIVASRLVPVAKKSASLVEKGGAESLFQLAAVVTFVSPPPPSQVVPAWAPDATINAMRAIADAPRARAVEKRRNVVVLPTSPWIGLSLLIIFMKLIMAESSQTTIRIWKVPPHHWESLYLATTLEQAK